MLARLASPWIAAGMFVVVASAAAAAVQVFGDPSSAGPRRTISLAPASASAEAAPRVSFADVAQTTPELGDLHMTDISALPAVTDASSEAPDGQVRIAMVETAPAAQLAPSPLARAPLAGYTQPGPQGPLPTIGRDGRTPAQVYARPFSGDSTRPKIAIVIGGLGFNAQATTQAIEQLPAEVTLSFVPYADNLQSWIDRARAHGHEVLLELPMEPFDPQADDTGPQTLLASGDPAQNTQRLEYLLSRAAGYFGVTNYQGARFAASAQAATPFVAQLRRRGVAFVSSGLGQRTALSLEAQRAALPSTTADRILDARRDADAIDEQLLNLEALALQNGAALGAGFAYPVTMIQVARWASDVQTRGYTLAPVSAVLAQRTQRR